MTFFTFTVLRQDFVAEDFCRVKLSTALPGHTSSFADCRFILRRELSSDTRPQARWTRNLCNLLQYRNSSTLGSTLGRAKTRLPATLLVCAGFQQPRLYGRCEIEEFHSQKVPWTFC